MIRTILFMMVSLILTCQSHAMEDHSKLIKKSYANGRDLTLRCLECHKAQGKDFIKTAHWLWKGETPFLKGHEQGAGLGKINLMNDY